MDFSTRCMKTPFTCVVHLVLRVLVRPRPGLNACIREYNIKPPHFFDSHGEEPLDLLRLRDISLDALSLYAIRASFLRDRLRRTLRPDVVDHDVRAVLCKAKAGPRTELAPIPRDEPVTRATFPVRNLVLE